MLRASPGRARLTAMRFPWRRKATTREPAGQEAARLPEPKKRAAPTPVAKAARPKSGAELALLAYDRSLKAYARALDDLRSALSNESAVLTAARRAAETHAECAKQRDEAASQWVTLAADAIPPALLRRGKRAGAKRAELDDRADELLSSFATVVVEHPAALRGEDLPPSAILDLEAMLRAQWPAIFHERHQEAFGALASPRERRSPSPAR